MDSFFRAAVCDLDKLLDDFELNADELDCKSVTLKPSVYPLSEASTIPTNLPDLNSVHYSSATSCPGHPTSHNHISVDSEVRGQPLTGVDLLSSVDCGSAKIVVPPCPDRALKPVRDLVSDTSSAVLFRADSNDVFRELDMVEKQMEEMGAPLVDVNTFVGNLFGEEVGGLSLAAAFRDTEVQQLSIRGEEQLDHDCNETVGKYCASLSLLDVLPLAAVESSAEAAEDSLSQTPTETSGNEELVNEVASLSQQVDYFIKYCERKDVLPADIVKDRTTISSNMDDKSRDPLNSNEPESLSSLNTSESKPVGLSCLPIAVSMCGALVNPKKQDEEYVQTLGENTEVGVSNSMEADALSALEARENNSQPEESNNLVAYMSVQTAEGRLSPEAQDLSPGSPVDPSLNPASSCLSDPSAIEFNFEYMPDSNQAELLVTDEELDAFLQSHTKTDQVKDLSYCNQSGVWSEQDCLEELNKGLEERLAEEELMSCVQGGQEGLEQLAESDRAMCVSVEESYRPAPPSPTQDSGSFLHLESELYSKVSHSLISDPVQSKNSGSPDEQTYGGARPKQLPCQPPSPPAAQSAEEVRIASQSSTDVCVTAIEGNSKPASSNPGSTKGDSDRCEPASLCPPQAPHGNSAVYNELSEPPFHPVESSRNGPKSVDEKGEEVGGLGCRQPAWVPDSEAPTCMNCCQRFTFTRRRHHCRACGKVYCATCCNRKCKLKYLEKEARVCIICFHAIHKAQALERMMSPTAPSPNPNVPSEYCSTIPPLQQARAAGTLNSPPPTVMVPVSVLKHPTNNGFPRKQKRVWFADGILPNGEVADTTKLSESSCQSLQELRLAIQDPPTSDAAASEVGEGGLSPPVASGAVDIVCPPVSGPWDYALLCGISSSVQRLPSFLPEDEGALPPLLITTAEDEAGDCSRQCWFLGSNGLQALGQREIVFVLECLPEEKALPKDLFTLYLNIYQDAQKGKFVEDLGNVTFSSSFLGSKDHGGMLFFSPTCQPLDGLTLPPMPFLFGLLIQRLEVPWAKVFPLRLLLRLGAEHGMYPTMLVSIRFRDSVYRETGHTIMNLLADLRNYQYSLPVVEGLKIHMEMGHSYIDIPKSSYGEMLKVVNSSNEHVISVGASFSPEADSHLVCFQRQDGNYQTQANSMPDKTRTVTGAGFVVFNGALKASSGFIAKSSIVEDGLMVQIPPETMESLRVALREQTDFHIACGKNDGRELRENVTIRWVSWSATDSMGITSGVDGRLLNGVHRVRMQQDREFESEGHTIRCTEVFYQLQNPDYCLTAAMPSCCVFQREVALATCSALTPHLDVLVSSGINCLSLRVSTQDDVVEYQAGSGSRLLPQHYMNELDSALIPVIHGRSATLPQTAVYMELMFYIICAI
ncbi:zinc finger FYVE domain-containing protein 16 isoform X2 [Lampris incognitus]|uniref:zinc finger FYVE domain-containing protein 16 isoform X2 n=1 Tax=Lampris incognitus TaxID=2546036 RepID=UPI0024B53C37|nr:zinc finger FYVE domain-containing protein 16 isoform X2 [Lampris incognitus]